MRDKNKKILQHAWQPLAFSHTNSMKDKEIQDVIDHLTQASYDTQRKLSPSISPERWGKIYGERTAKILENNYQKKLLK